MRLETLDFVGKGIQCVCGHRKNSGAHYLACFFGAVCRGTLKAEPAFPGFDPRGHYPPVNLGAAVPGKLYTTEFEFDPSLLGEGQYFFYVDVFDGVLAQAVCLDKPSDRVCV